MLNKYTLLFISIIFFSNSFAFGQSLYLITGKVKPDSTEQTLSIPVVLMEIKMEAKPSIKPIQKTTSDSSGDFRFTLSESPADTYYRVSTVIDGQLIGTNPVKFEKDSRKIDLLLTIPKIIEGLKKLNFIKNILVFDLWENSVRVTDILVLENRSGAIIDASKGSFKRILPLNAKNINILNPPRGAEIKQVGNEISYKLILPPGRHQLHMIYDIPADTESIDLINPLPPALEQMEIIVPKKTIQANFGPKYIQVVRQDKTFNKQDFYSQTINVGEGVSSVRVILSEIPMAQKRLFYPAIILLILLISGLFWYIKSKLSSNHRQ